MPVIFRNLNKKISDAGIVIVSGSGHRQSQIVKDFHSLKKMLLKTLEYEEIEAICGSGRNSYYKTDKDATAMCLKSDYYSGLGSNMHAAYSLQIIVAKGFILDFLYHRTEQIQKLLSHCLTSIMQITTFILNDYVLTVVIIR